MIARILSFHDGVGIEYQTNIWGVINAILCDGTYTKKWHTLYLIALKAYPQTLTEDHQERVAVWRKNVVESIREEEETYVRETRLGAAPYSALGRARAKPTPDPTNTSPAATLKARLAPSPICIRPRRAASTE